MIQIPVSTLIDALVSLPTPEREHQRHISAFHEPLSLSRKPDPNEMVNVKEIEFRAVTARIESHPYHALVWEIVL